MSAVVSFLAVGHHLAVQVGCQSVLEILLQAPADDVHKILPQLLYYIVKVSLTYSSSNNSSG
eukprot:CAMPEP_0170510792 /NCGR_PEP_ID=MMETSP0208-20121228/65955_1 /TAXON_ID=197538 /ORGANISM="Strombidium inclinatum, Strain S3" /LENGTH=61 /DNA_ID=CAMNT_0010794279 /DNA_START=1106 /DNA_END=1291 /DNA_ORIENTATION=+